MENTEPKIRTKEEWLAEFDLAMSKCKWFIDQYFPGLYPQLLKLRVEKNAKKLFSVLNSIWYDLPDSKFNIIESPEGWSEFLHLIEFWNDEEANQVLK